MRIRIALLLLTVALAGPGSSAAQQRRSVIAGLVVSTNTLEPIANVRVSLVGTGRSVLTDVLGRFLFDSLRAATYLVQARGDSDETPLTSVEVGERERIDLLVKLGQPDPNRLPDLVSTAEAPPADPLLRIAHARRRVAQGPVRTGAWTTSMQREGVCTCVSHTPRRHCSSLSN